MTEMGKFSSSNTKVQQIQGWLFCLFEMGTWKVQYHWNEDNALKSHGRSYVARTQVRKGRRPNWTRKEYRKYENSKQK